MASVNRRHFVSSAAAFALGTRAADALSEPTTAPALQFQTSLRERLQTRAELSQYAETSSNTDVERFLTTLDLRGAPVQRGLLGVSARGRPIPYVVSSRPMILDGEDAHKSRKPVVFIVANGRANEPDGKEAALAVLRDLAVATDHTLLEDLVLVVIPNLDVDGNANLVPVALSAPTLNGPARVGSARDGASIDLERDFIALQSYAVRQLVDLAKYWNPDVYIDLRTGATSLTTFALTYAPSAHPAAFYGGTYARDTMLPELRTQIKTKFGIDAFTAGGFGKNGPLSFPTPGVELGWYAPDGSARLGSNYFGIRGVAAIAGYAYPHDTFERRVFSLRAFLSTALQYCSDKSDEIIARTKTAAHWTTGAVPVRTARDPHASGQELISWQRPAIDPSPRDREVGLPPGEHLDGRFQTSSTPVFDRFAGTFYAQQPYAYAVDVANAPLARQMLARHGVRFDVREQATTYEGESFVPRRVERVAQSDGTRATVAEGAWMRGVFTLAAGSLLVLGEQPLGPLVSLLLEPQSDDGLVTLHVFDATLAAGREHAVRRVTAVQASH